MDEILKLKDINQVSDKNGQLYSFLDGFITTLSDFHEEYEKQLADRDKEIGAQLDSHSSYLKKLNDDREEKFTKYTNSFSNYVQKNMREIERLEDEYETLRSRQKTDFSDAEKKSSLEFNTKMKTYCLGPLGDVEMLLRKCEQIIPNNLYSFGINTSRFVEKWEEEQTKVVPGEYVIDFSKNSNCIVDYLKQARLDVELFDHHAGVLTEYKATNKIEGVAWQDRKKYIESLVDEMVPIAGKVYRLFAMSEEIKKDAKEYFGGIKKNSISSMRDANANGVDEAEKAVEDKKKAVRAEIKMNMTKYNRDIEELNRKYYIEIKTKREQYAAEEKELKEKWDSVVSERLARFFDDMETKYPGDAIEKMMKDARGDYRDLMKIPYAKDEVVKNVPIGELLVDVPSEFKDGEAGKVINKFFQEKYATLFAEAVVDEEGNAAEFEKFSIPYSVSLAKGVSACIKHKDEEMDAVAAIMNSLAIRTLWSVPAGMINYHLFDVEYLSTFNPLRKLDPGVRDEEDDSKSFIAGGRICDGASLISDQLADARMHFDKRLINSDDCADIIEYNEKHDKKRTFEMNLVATYPQGMNAESINRMSMLTEGCGNWGFSTICALADRNEEFVESPELKKVHSRFCKSAMVLRYVDSDKLFIESSPNEYENGATLQLYSVPLEDSAVMSKIAAQVAKA